MVTQCSGKALTCIPLGSGFEAPREQFYAKYLLLSSKKIGTGAAHLLWPSKKTGSGAAHFDHTSHAVMCTTNL
jgi:hypothetical protein